jgi:hypothetical protein
LIVLAKNDLHKHKTEAGFMVSQSNLRVPAADAKPRIALLTRAKEGRFVVEDFTRFPKSLEWDLGEAYLNACGAKGFVQDKTPIPWAINNDGTLSSNAAEVFFQSLLAADEAGNLAPDIFVLELGIGVGLFARFFLDAFRERCEAEGTSKVHGLGSAGRPGRRGTSFGRNDPLQAGTWSARLVGSKCELASHGVRNTHQTQARWLVPSTVGPRCSV